MATSLQDPPGNTSKRASKFAQLAFEPRGHAGKWIDNGLAIANASISLYYSRDHKLLLGKLELDGDEFHDWTTDVSVSNFTYLEIEWIDRKNYEVDDYRRTLAHGYLRTLRAIEYQDELLLGNCVVAYVLEQGRTYYELKEAVDLSSQYYPDVKFWWQRLKALRAMVKKGELEFEEVVEYIDWMIYPSPDKMVEDDYLRLRSRRREEARKHEAMIENSQAKRTR
jgi:hypothetical protein